MSHFDNAFAVLYENRERFGGVDMMAVARHLASKLDELDLLKTDLHERALRACEAMAAYYDGTGPNPGSGPDHPSAIGRESLALKAHKPRWTTRGNEVLFDGELWGCFYGTTHSDGSKKAREFIEARNAEASK